MKTDLKCLACGRAAKLVLHGASYCQPCALKNVNSPNIKATDNSPLEREARRTRIGAQPSITDTHIYGYRNPVFTTAMLNRSGKKPKTLAQRKRSQARNSRRRGLRKARARRKVSAGSP